MPDNSTAQSHIHLDITPFVCPMTFVRTRLALDRLQPQQTLEIRLKGDEPKTNIPKSVAELGHQVLSIQDQPDGTAILRVRKR